MDVSRYLQRINFDGPVEPTAATLRNLQLAHLYSVPFENLSIHAREPIVLNDEALFEKIVSRRRGGFCYELNGLFAALLRELGFQVQMLSAGVVNSEGVFGPEFDHMVLVVTLEEPWLVDVGFGDSFTEPLRLNEMGEQVQGARAYQIRDEGAYKVLFQRDYDGIWSPQYRFTLRPRQYADYEAMCLYQQTSPESHFTRKRICTRLSPAGRTTLSDHRLITTSNTGHKTDRPVADERECAEILREEFGIAITTV